MPAAFEDKSDEFVETMNSLLKELSGGSDHRGECTIEAAHLVSGVVDADDIEDWEAATSRTGLDEVCAGSFKLPPQGRASVAI